MSDFLSNFGKDNYGKKPEQRNQEQANEQKSEHKQEQAEEKSEQLPVPATTQKSVVQPMTRSENHRKDEETEFDPTYKKKQQKKKKLIVAGLIGICGLSVLLYYQTTHVRLPDFTGKELADARSWAGEHKMKLDLKQQYDKQTEANKIISQKQKAKKNVKKGSTLQLTASMGADPEEQLELPDFMQMSKSDAEKWIKEQQASNISIVEEFHETEEAGKALRMEFGSGEEAVEHYFRKDKLKLYYSKGKESYRKNISVPDFYKKTRAEAETWGKNNEVEVLFEEVSSPDIAADTIIGQNIAKDEKVAKKDQLTVTVSLGKGIVVPNFAEYTIDEAASAVEGLAVQVKTLYTEEMGYGQLVSQSREPGAELTTKDDPKVTVVYSAGQPYLKDLRGTTVEGDLQKLFYDEFQSKGANVNYQIRYVDSAEAKGMVVGMSAHSQYIPLNYTVYLDISLGNLSGTQQYGNPNSESGDSGAEQ